MDFIEIEYREKNTPNLTVAEMQSHDYYELYFLLEGTRDIFFENKMFILPQKSFCVFPPFHLHKTEGGFYKRIIVYISRELLTPTEESFLQTCQNSVAFHISPEDSRFFFDFLKKAAFIKETTPNRKEYLLAFTKTLFYFLQTYKLTPVSHTAALPSQPQNDSFILKVVSFINNNYSQPISLDSLSKEFFISKNTLCKRFQSTMKCSIMSYCTYVRLNEAKQLLLSTNKSLDKIAEECGFSSANYFSLIFKQKIGLSPLNWKKKR